jgi:hypothetical protein
MGDHIRVYYECECGKISYWFEPRCVRCDSDNILTKKVVDFDWLLDFLSHSRSLENAVNDLKELEKKHGETH